jgi:hypothetical protein
MSGHLSFGIPDTNLSGLSESEALMKKTCLTLELTRCLDLMEIKPTTFNALNMDGNTEEVLKSLYQIWSMSGIFRIYNLKAVIFGRLNRILRTALVQTPLVALVACSSHDREDAVTNPMAHRWCWHLS